jgi:hypothetical protein
VSEQIDIAVDLGAVAPPLPEIFNLRQLVESAPAPPPQIIEGVLHQGCKLILGRTSKSNKSWCLPACPSAWPAVRQQGVVLFTRLVMELLNVGERAEPH